MKFVATTLSGAFRIDVVFNVYWPDSMKNTEIGQHSVGKIQLKAIVGAVSITHSGAVLSDGNNKSNWQFLVDSWANHPSIIGNL